MVIATNEVKIRFTAEDENVTTTIKKIDGEISSLTKSWEDNGREIQTTTRFIDENNDMFRVTLRTWLPLLFFGKSLSRTFGDITGGLKETFEQGLKANIQTQLFAGWLQTVGQAKTEVFITISKFFAAHPEWAKAVAVVSEFANLIGVGLSAAADIFLASQGFKLLFGSTGIFSAGGFLGMFSAAGVAALTVKLGIVLVGAAVALAFIDLLINPPPPTAAQAGTVSSVLGGKGTAKGPGFEGISADSINVGGPNVGAGTFNRVFQTNNFNVSMPSGGFGVNPFDPVFLGNQTPGFAAGAQDTIERIKNGEWNLTG